MEIDLSILDKLINDHVPFAMYRLPASENVHLIVQQGNQVYKTVDFADLSDKSGFVMSPFEITEHSPIILIRPDLHLHGVGEINRFSEGYVSSISNESVVYSENTSTSKENYEQMFSAFQNELNSGNFQKLVLSRKQILALPKNFSFSKVFSKALSIYSNTFVYIAHTPITGVWIGSTPELFLSEKNNLFHTVALAGTQTAKKGQEPIVWSEKNVQEQQMVADYMKEQLEKKSLPYTHSDTYTLRVGGLAHLKTDFHFQRIGDISIGEILEMIHPSPAVCGLPKAEAFAFINQVESHSRSYYSGFVGNLKMDNSIDLYVNLRCMQITNNSVSLYAGGGILASSDQEEEWKETEDKMQTMLNILSI